MEAFFLTSYFLGMKTMFSSSKFMKSKKLIISVGISVIQHEHEQKEKKEGGQHKQKYFTSFKQRETSCVGYLFFGHFQSDALSTKSQYFISNYISPVNVYSIPHKSVGLSDNKTSASALPFLFSIPFCYCI